jgi:cobyrinic acid a,c-diamide synthase
LSRSIPRLVIAGTHSGSGKTSITLALVAALRKRGLKVQTFKVGPDFLDPSYLALASGRPCYNLDGWMTGQAYVQELFQRVSQDADLALIEGVMGLFDGADPVHSEGSTAEIVHWLKAPVVLVANVHGQARSLAALVKGFNEFDPELRLAGIIANQSGSAHHGEWLKASLEATSLPPLLGCIARGTLPTLNSRHLGLVTADRQNLSTEILDQLAQGLESQVRLEVFLEKARSVHPWNLSGLGEKERPHEQRISVGWAYDQAFHFYYQDNLDVLRRRGTDLIPFSMLKDDHLPAGLDGLVLGGGYPEEYARELADNQLMLQEIRAFALQGKPIYAECGGLMVLTQGIETLEGRRYPLVGLLPVWTRMLPRLKSLGYVQVQLIRDSLWGTKGDCLRGHEFHYSELLGNPCDQGVWQPVYALTKRRRQGITPEGFQSGQVLASYAHLHWASKPQAVEAFIGNCEKVK